MVVQVAREQRTVRAAFFPRHPAWAPSKRWTDPQPNAAPPSPSTPTKRFSANTGSNPPACSNPSAPRPTCFPASKSAGNRDRRRRNPNRSHLPLPRRPIRLPQRNPRFGNDLRRQPFAGTVDFTEKFNTPGQGRMGDQLDPVARRLHPVLLQHRAHARRRHARGGLLGRDPQRHQSLRRAWQINNRKAAKSPATT